MNTKLTSKKFMIMLFVIIGALVFLGSVVGSALAADNSPFSVVYAKEGYENAGPDALYEIPSWGLLCIDDNGATHCYCKCTSGVCEAKDGTLVPVTTLPGNTAITQTATPGTPSATPSPTATSQAPTATLTPTWMPSSTPIPNGQWVKHFNANGVEEWKRCIKGWSGHLATDKTHKGHIVPDEIGPACYTGGSD